MSISLLMNETSTALGQNFDVSGPDNRSSNPKLNAMIEKYKELLNQKHELKLNLKAYDDDFQLKYNRQPRKAEKEVHLLDVVVTRALFINFSSSL
jgi:hypothetical protein